MSTGKFNARGNPAIDQHPIPGGVEKVLVASCYIIGDKLWPDGPLGSYANLTYLYFLHLTACVLLLLFSIDVGL